jgi:hypothetical protein
LPLLICLAIALHDVDGPIHCQSGEKIRLQGIGATETDGSCNPNQPCVPGNPFEQRRTMARAMGAVISKEDNGQDGTPDRYGQAWFTRPVRLVCDVTGTSHKRLTAWCGLPSGRDVSCEAIKAGVAMRWARYDPKGRLRWCLARQMPN